MPGLLPVAPLQSVAFRRLWMGGLISNMGTMIQGVGAGWLMTSISTSPVLVALVQAATTLPIMLLSVPSGALADIIDRRHVLLTAQLLMMATAAAMTVAVVSGAMAPWLLLVLTFLMGCGTALHTPSWQASVGDLVPREHIPSAVTLNSIGLNLTRSTGPALGGFIVAFAGPAAAFACNALSFIPMIAALMKWPVSRQEEQLPAEDFGRALVAGLRYTAMSPDLLSVMARGFLFGISAIAILALLPLIVRELLNGGAMTYGFLLGSFGIGALGGGLANNFLRQKLSSELIVRSAFTGFAVCAVLIGASRYSWLTSLLLVPAGACWVLALSLFNVVVQLSTPRWVVGRTLALYQTASFGGMTLGAWLWGSVAGSHGIEVSLLASAAVSCTGVLLGYRLRLPELTSPNLLPRNNFMSPSVALEITPKSGPIRVMVEYEVPLANDEQFLTCMVKRRRIKIRDGAIRWVLLRDVETPTFWRETYTYPTWAEYLRSNHRPTQADAVISASLKELTVEQRGPTVRRMIERHTVSATDTLPVKTPIDAS